MRQSKYQAGDEVIISKTLRVSETQDRFKVVTSMYEMQGKLFKIESVDSNSVMIYSDAAGRSYRFHISDIRPYQLDHPKIFLKEKKKHIFDPELLYL